MSETMVDRVAKAIRDYVAGIEVGSKATVEAPDPMVHAETYARIVIAAMREPTADMIRAVRDKDEERQASRHHPITDDWQLMIDAALAPAFKGTSNG